MRAIDNSATLDYDKKDRSPKAAVNFSYVAGTKVLTITDATAYAAGVARKALNIEVFDRFGGKKVAQITAADVDNAVDIALGADDANGKALNVTEGVSINVTLVVDNGVTKDGSVHDVATLKSAGSVEMAY